MPEKKPATTHSPVGTKSLSQKVREGLARMTPAQQKEAAIILRRAIRKRRAELAAQSLPGVAGGMGVAQD